MADRNNDRQESTIYNLVPKWDIVIDVYEN